MFLLEVIAERSYPQRLAFSLISEARSEFEKHFSTELSQAHASGLPKASKPLFKRMWDKYDDAAKVDKIASVALQVDQVKGVMQNNIQSALKVRMKAMPCLVSVISSITGNCKPLTMLSLL